MTPTCVQAGAHLLQTPATQALVSINGKVEYPCSITDRGCLI